MRYAVYYAPPEGSALARFGAAWLGWDPAAGVECEGLELPGLPAPRAELTAIPRRYGFHGTLKPPFRLAEGCDAAALDAALAELAGALTAFDLPPLGLATIGSFLALVPTSPSPELAAAADACVTRLDWFRAPPRETELARRRAAGLTARQAALLARWGYPYVLDQFQFHLTLTGPLVPALQAATRVALAPALAPFIGPRVPFPELCLFAEGGDGRFRIRSRHRLGAPAARR